MKNKKFFSIAIVAILMIVCLFALVACVDNNNSDDPKGDEHVCESQCHVCGKCTNEDCTENACKDKCKGHEGLQDYDMSGVSLTDKTVTYNGEEQTLTITGTLPTGVTVKYEYYKGKEQLAANPVNAGEYLVVAKFTGDANHNAIDDKTATLTIEKADLEIALGATQYVENNVYKDLGEGNEVHFIKKADGTFVHEYDGIEYAVTVLDSNADVENINIEFYVDEELEVDTGDTVENVGAIIYIVVTLDEFSDDYVNINPTLTTSLAVEKRTVNLSTVEDLELLRTEITSVDVTLRLNTRYVLNNDINLDGKIWKTIGAANDERGDNFKGEFDGQGHKIHNFRIDETSVDEDVYSNETGVSFGFFGFLHDAYIHDIAFEDFEVSVDVANVPENYDFRGSPANPICFGIVAGRTKFSSTMGTHFENITVANAEIYFATYGGFYGAVIGEEYAGQGGAGSNEGTGDTSQGRDDIDVEIIRKNLDVSNVKITAVEVPSNSFGRLSIGGLVGELMFDTHVYEDCDVSDIVLVNGDSSVHSKTFTGRRSQQNGYYTSNVGGFIGLDYSTWQVSTFKNCTLKNYRIETWVNQEGYAGIGDFYSGTMRGISGGDAVGSGVDLIDCTATNDEGGEYGLFRHQYQEEQWCQYEYNPETQRWIKYVEESEDNWVKQEGVEYDVNPGTDIWDKYVYNSDTDAWDKYVYDTESGEWKQAQ